MSKFEADEVLNLAIMEKTPYIIVEGVDDIRIYEDIAGSAGVVGRLSLRQQARGFVRGRPSA